MSLRLVTVTVLYAAMLTGWAAWSGLTGRPLTAVLVMSLALLEVLIVGQVAADAVQLAAGYRPASTATHAGYLAAAVVALPMSAGPAVGRALREGPVRGDAALAAFGCGVTLILLVRLAMTWPAHA